MSLACTLLGHRFGDPEIRDEREERGEEVITVTREVAVCERCGEERVLSENTEVTSIVEPADTSEEDGTASAAVETDEDDPAPPDDASPVHPRVDEFPEDPEAPGASNRSGGEPPEDDAIILDDEDDGERGYGEWPETGGEWDPDAPPGGALDDDEDDTGTEPEAEADDGTPAEDRSFEEVDATAPLPEAYRCPTCGFRTSAAGSALRAGDSCPDCGEAYLVPDGPERNH